MIHIRIVFHKGDDIISFPYGSDEMHKQLGYKKISFGVYKTVKTQDATEIVWLHDASTIHTAVIKMNKELGLI